MNGCFPAVLRKCSLEQKRSLLLSLLDSCKSVRELKQIHAQLTTAGLTGDTFATSKVVAFFSASASRCIDYARAVFRTIRNPSIFAWNCMIRSLVAGDNPREAIIFFSQMLKGGFQPNNFTFPFVVKACTDSSAVDFGISVHAHIVKSGLDRDAYVQSSLIHMYSRSNRLEDAYRLFAGSSDRDVVSWNAMIDGYVRTGDLTVASSLFDQMVCKDVVSWNTMITGYSNLGRLEDARKLFDESTRRNIVSWNAMLTGYAKAGDVESARHMFDKMPQRDVVSWNAMIACYSQCNRSIEALLLFDEMRAVCVNPTEATLVCILSACADLGALDRGKRLHSFLDAHRIKLNTVLGTALTDMYAKCGSIEEAIQVFHLIPEKDVLSWNTIIAGLAMHGHVKRCYQLFMEMIQSGSEPDDITFVAMLSSYSHAGMVEEGLRLLDCMSSTFNVTPKAEHYGCVIDLLGRAGLLEKAMELISGMPMEPNAGAWGALLGACRIHGNVELGERVGKHLIALEPEHSGRYVLLSNVYAFAKRWEDARKVRKMMNTRGVSKPPGFSFIEMKGNVHRFIAGDKTHPENELIHQMLREIHERLRREEGYVPDTKQILFDLEEEEREQALSVHSEKLAVAFGLIHRDTESVMRIVKNLRFCTDCHNFMKLVSKVYKQEIVARDRNRFHHFIMGSCSCGDYW
ncbi:pentatricopeptide repeat-containing protein At1g08070, chloroplastic-like [Nymphaea colorata]|uniref:DYW domain-containing protein n=1 Tax=Nymphaea colorata TaxID=210225 RepID=A0A5K1GMP0_9MAGN|nr:pentatricopeptide repeat-containing protein At1g08070, chloroplastic-like [Nymphaea colorata]